MTVETCCGGGRRLIYRAINGNDLVSTVESPFDGTEVPVKVPGQSSNGTMTIKRIDDHHYLTSMKIDGKPFGSRHATLSADGKTLTVESEIPAAAGQPPGKQTEVWIRK